MLNKLYDTYHQEIDPSILIKSRHQDQFNVHDQGMLRRLALIPFAYRIPDADRIERYEDILLKERSGILNWLLDGWEMYKKDGLSPFPEAVSTAMSDYTNECDTLKQFIEEYYIEVPGAYTLMKDFTAKYNDWAKENHYPQSNSRSLASDLRKEGKIVETGNYNQLLIRSLGLRE